MKLSYISSIFLGKYKVSTCKYTYCKIKCNQHFFELSVSKYFYRFELYLVWNKCILNILLFTRGGLDLHTLFHTSRLNKRRAWYPLFISQLSFFSLLYAMHFYFILILPSKIKHKLLKFHMVNLIINVDVQVKNNCNLLRKKI